MQISVVLEDIYRSLSSTLLKISLALLIFFVGFIIGKLLGRLIEKLLKEVEINNIIKNTTGIRLNVEQLVSNFVAYAIYFLSLVAALEQIGLANIVLYLLSGAVLIIILLSFFIAIRDFLPNLISGIYLYRKESFQKGKKIQINEIVGVVEQLDLLQLKIKTKKGDIIYIPNSVVAKSKVKISA